MVAWLVVSFTGAGDLAHEGLQAPCPEQWIRISQCPRRHAQRNEHEAKLNCFFLHETLSSDERSGERQISTVDLNRYVRPDRGSNSWQADTPERFASGVPCRQGGRYTTSRVVEVKKGRERLALGGPRLVPGSTVGRKAWDHCHAL